MSKTEKRSVSTDALETLGTIIGNGEKRDAIHLAVEPATAAHPLHPGDDVGFVEGGVGACDNPLGIVDPFLKGIVKKGQRFWLVLYPRQITSLRHVWSHPAFPEEVEDVLEDVSVLTIPVKITSSPTPTVKLKSEQSKSEECLRKYATAMGVSYTQLLDHAQRWIIGGDYWSEGGRLESEYLPEEFWDHYELVTGATVPDEHRGSFFSCSC